MYDSAGRMSPQLMDPDRPTFASGDLTRGSDAELRAAVAGYIAYDGTYTLDPTRGIVTHEEVIAVANRTRPKFIRLMRAILRALDV